MVSEDTRPPPIRRRPLHDRVRRPAGLSTDGPPAATMPAAVVVVVAVALVTLAPEPVVLGVQRLAAVAIMVTGAAVLVARVGAADLALAAVAGVGAYAGGVAPAMLGLPAWPGLLAAAGLGGLVGAAAGALHGRLGRTLGALASLSLAVGVVALLTVWPPGGGVAGFHAVALPTPWGLRADALAVVAVLAVAVTGATAWSRRRSAALAALAVRAPDVVRSLGHRPAVATASAGVVAGALCATGGLAMASTSGSVLPGAYGLDLAAALALAGLVGGLAPRGPLAGTALVWGPSTLWPLAPVVGTAPPLLLMGPVALAVVALRRGRPLAWPPPRPSTADLAPRPPGRSSDPDPGVAPPTPAAPADGTLRVRDLLILGRPVDLDVAAGEVVALVGPNGAGKSTLLAKVGGQLPDGGHVEVGGHRPPRGARARARRGVARTWQRTPGLPAHDVDAVVTGADPEARAAAAWARAVLGARDPVEADAQLVLLAAARPALALLDEPTEVAPTRLAAFVRGLADGGAAVLVVDHRPEVVATADRVVDLTARSGIDDGP